MPQINPHILFKGNTEAAFNFYQAIFDGEIKNVMRLKDLQTEDTPPLPDSIANNIVFIELALDNGQVLLGSDVGPQFEGQELVTGNRHTIFLQANNKEQADQYFNGLAEGGEIEMPISDSFGSAYFGMVTDKFGIQWMVRSVG